MLVHCYPVKNEVFHNFPPNIKEKNENGLEPGLALSSFLIRKRTFSNALNIVSSLDCSVT